MAAGSLARISGSGQALPGLTAAVIDLGTINSDPDSILTETSAGRYRPNSAGYYLVTARGRFDTTHNNRLNIAWKIWKNGAATPGGSGSSYARNNNNPFAYPSAAAVMYFNGSTDFFEIADVRDAGSGTPAGSYNFTRAKIVQLTTGAASATPYGCYGTPTAGAYTGTTPTATTGWDAVTESDTSVIQLQAGGTAIRLKEANRAYLVVYTLENSDAGTTRTQRLSDVTLGGSRVAHSVGYAYQRDSSNQRGYPNGIAMVRPTSANQDINVRAWGYSISTADWTQFDNGSWTLAAAAGTSGITVIALPTSAAIAIFEDATGNQSVRGPTDVRINAFRSTVTADSPFSRVNNTSVDVGAAIDVFAYSATLVERQTTSGARNTSGFRWVKEGVEIDESKFGTYLRGDQGTQDTPNMVLSTIFCDSVASGDTFEVEKFDPGTDDGANDFTWPGTGAATGGFFLSLASLNPPPSNPIITTVGGDNDLLDGETAAIVGTLFGATQGTGKVEISDNATYATGTKILQPVTAWSASSITITTSLGTLLPGTPRYVWVTSGTTVRSASHTIGIHRKKAFTLSNSPNIAGGGTTPTTSQLTGGTGTFTAGKVSDDTNPVTADIGDGGKTEIEFSIKPTTDAGSTAVYEFKIVTGTSTQLDAYTVTPLWTITQAARAKLALADVTKVYLGSTEVTKAYLGNTVIWG